MQQITSDELSRFEEELNQFTFREIPVGSLIGSHLNLDFLYGHFNPNDHLKELATTFYIKHLPSKRIKGFDFNKHQNEKGLPILAFLSDRRHLFNMSYPIFEKLGPENVFCLIKNIKVLQQFQIKPAHFSFFNELPTYDYEIWHKGFKQIWKDVAKKSDIFIARNKIHKYYKFRLKNNLLGETQLIMAFEKLLDYLEPRQLITPYDRYSYLAPLFSVAKKQQIPCFTMMHGTVNNSIGYTPLIADKVLVWGERQKQSLINYGLNESQILVTGATQINNEISGNKNALKSQLEIPVNAKVIVLSTNPTRVDLRIKLYKIFCDAISSLPKNEYYGFVKLHPSENKVFYENLGKPSNVIFGDSKVISFENTFALADVVCNYNSAFAIDAILRSLPLITINVDNIHLGQAKDYIEYGKLPQAKSSTELVDIILDYFGKSNNQELMKKVINYAKVYCIDTGKSAAENMLKCIENDIN